MRKIVIAFSMVLLLTLIGGVAAADLGTLTVVYQDGSQTTSPGYRPGNSGQGAVHFEAVGGSPVQSASLQIGCQVVPWNGRNGAENIGVPTGYQAGVWHWIWNGQVLTISHVTGQNPVDDHGDPGNGTDPGNNTDPGDPGNSTDQGNNTDPGNGTGPIDPVDPGNETSPVNPVEPADPGSPAKTNNSTITVEDPGRVVPMQNTGTNLEAMAAAMAFIMGGFLLVVWKRAGG